MQREQSSDFRWLLLSALAATATACGSSGDSGGGAPPQTVNVALTGTVAGAPDVTLDGATVYLVPTDLIDLTPMTPAGVLARTTEAFDEPLEDLVAAAGGSFASATTDASGEFSIDTVPDGRFYVYVEPAGTDLEHLPGGSLCRVSRTADELRGTDHEIRMSSSPGATATYSGMSTCLLCHEEYEAEISLAHRLGFRVPGVSSPLQSLSEHPETDDGLAYFLDTASYTGGTPVYHYDYDSSRGFDKFKTSLTDPTPGGGVVSAILWLWHDTATSTYKITIENVGNPGDPGNFAERTVELTYGGAVYKQRYMMEWPGRNGRYPILQFQTHGSEDIYDRTRKVFRDYHLDFYWTNSGTPADPSDDLIQDPSLTRTIERNCMGCHSPGYTQYTDTMTGEVLCDSVEDPSGEFDLDDDGMLNDLNISCESCHGPGSEHVALAFSGVGRYIVAPELITSSRAVQICARCHDRQVGNGTVMNDHPLNSADEWPLPGISRADYLTDHTSRPGPAAGSFWVDFEHSKSHHQQGPDFLRSAHYRNGEQLLACSDCHDMHGGTGHRHALVADPDERDSPLCMSCHAEDIVSTNAHTTDVLGVTHGGFSASCIDCHMTGTAKTGAGEYGYLLATPTGGSGDAATTYFENDITSHSFDVIPKDALGILGVTPGSAMPSPYTNRCGTCHDPSNLPH